MTTTRVLARKWRPKSFAELTGQEHVVRALTNALVQKRLHHAYLFTGTRGVGKTTVARILAKALNCETGITPEPCGVCSACVEIDGGRYVDLLELDAASNTGIDNMREVLDNAQYLPTSGRFKVYIIDEVHMLSTKAFNSMLKTLEEPPEHVKFILATTDPQKIPVTVLSRCLQFNLKQIPESLIGQHLEKILQAEEIAAEPGAIHRIARAAHGSMRDALSLMDQAIAYSGGKVEDEMVRNMLGAIDQEYLYSILDALADRDGERLFAIAQSMEARSLEYDAALQDLASLLHRVALARIVPAALDEEGEEREKLVSLAARISPEDVQLFYQFAIRGREELELAPDEYAGFSMTLLRMLAFLPGMEATQAAPPSGNLEAPKRSEPSPKAPAPKQEMRKAADSGEFDWVSVSANLGLSGMAKMLAHHCALTSFENGKMEFSVPPAHRHLLDRSYQDRVKASILEYLGRPVEVSFSVGEGITPAKVEVDQKEARQMEAVASIEQDPGVRRLVENYDAKLIESSIKPI